MKVAVILKQVPDTETKFKINGDQKSIDTASIKWIVNPYDEYAIEEVVKFKEKNPSAQTFAFSLGPKAKVVDALRTALAMGVDEAIAIDTDKNLDPLQTAFVLSETIKAEGEFKFILAGKSSIDGNSFAVPQMVAEFLNIPSLSIVSKIEYAEQHLTATKDVDGGSKETYQISTPCLLSVTKGLNTPRYASLPGIMKAKKKTIKEVNSSQYLNSFNVDTCEIETYAQPAERPAGKIFSAQQIGELVSALVNESKVL